MTSDDIFYLQPGEVQSARQAAGDLQDWLAGW